jgi:hypothetical protein
MAQPGSLSYVNCIIGTCVRTCNGVFGMMNCDLSQVRQCLAPVLPAGCTCQEAREHNAGHHRKEQRECPQQDSASQ